ncbi:zinc/manganese transport system substrate-binding protein [Parvibaculum indicum]|uniref:metal ABC transporter substrate-binding protein n=1 Tax=Parvibaculum indicum TaxID=562969 RepID=UPI00141FBA13|nr:metal ABC transporter substrate-binding protein [Parvibaculum indicum]NIJ40289.1 zinc/manganese transport system substrate-binding protein [Parvibaculum indicum]
MKHLMLAAGAAFLLSVSPLHAAPLKVVTSISILADMVHQLTGGNATVTSLVPPNGDAHSFEPSPADAKALAEADLVVVNGLALETWMHRLTEASGYKGPVIVASKGVDPLVFTPGHMEHHAASAGHEHAHEHEHEHDEDGHHDAGDHHHGNYDPHAWQDLANGKIYVGNIEAALEKADPQHADIYATAARNYIYEINALDKWVRAEIDKVPAAKRKVITSHDAFGYFGAAYSVTFAAPEGINTEAEVNARDLARLVDQIKEEKIKALFIENMSDPRMMQTIARETGAEQGGELYSDALSPPGGEAPTYLDMFRVNVPRLVAAMEKN